MTNSRPFIGSLFTGYGGLDEAVEKLTGGTTVFVSDIDPGPVAYLRTRHPDVPNIGDMTMVDWADHAGVDVLCGGYPCQPFSSAGRQLGRDDHRHLWPNVLEALKTLRPARAFFENVRGHLNLGFDQVLQDLTANGYNVRWSIVAASSVGAAHRRERLYIYAYNDPDAELVDLAGLPRTTRGGAKVPPAGETYRGRVVPCPRADAGATFANPLFPTPNATMADRGPAKLVGGVRPSGQRRQVDINTVVGRDLPGANPLLPTPQGADSYVGRPRTTGRPVEKSTSLSTIVTVLPGAEVLLPTPLARDAKGPSLPSRQGGLALPDLAPDLAGAGAWAPDNAEAWGKYAPAVARWSAITRPAPPPVEPNTKGNPRLTATFAEWLMGLEEGRLTGADIGLSRSQALKLAGNGVVPQAAYFALSHLTSY